jgi:OmpA-OmpF porin, OOP family
MRLPESWRAGLIPLCAVFLVSAWWMQPAIEADLAARGTSGLAAAGLEWARIEISGRDARVLGEAPSPDSRALAVAAADRVFGIREVDDAMTVLPEVRPFTLTVLRDGTKVTLTGSVPAGSARATLLERARQAIPGVNLVDQLKPARGAPANFEAITAYGLGELRKLGEGTLSISDQALALTGRAADFASYADIRAKLAVLPAGVKLTKGLAPGDILPPLVRPFVFVAEKSVSGLALGGYVPSEAIKTRLLGEARAAGLPLRDGVQVADGAVGGDWAGAAVLLVRELGRLESGKATLTDDKVAVIGKGRDLVGEEDVRADLRALPAGFVLTQAAIESRAIRPYVFNAAREEGRLRLSGYVPGPAAKAEILDTARRYFEGEAIEDALAEGLGEPKDFGPAVRLGLQELARLGTGATLALSDDALSIRGLAPFDFAREQIAATLRGGLPAGFRGAFEIGTAPLPPPVTLSPACQALYQEVLSRGAIRFKVASADLSEESRGMLDRLTVVTLRCTEAKVEIGGHTDSDGSAQTNAELSRRRAETVGAYFLRAGIPAERLEAVGYGHTVPVAPNDTPENKAKNRRIEFLVK